MHIPKYAAPAIWPAAAAPTSIPYAATLHAMYAATPAVLVVLINPHATFAASAASLMSRSISAALWSAEALHAASDELIAQALLETTSADTAKPLTAFLKIFLIADFRK